MTVKWSCILFFDPPNFSKKTDEQQVHLFSVLSGFFLGGHEFNHRFLVLVTHKTLHAVY